MPWIRKLRVGDPLACSTAFVNTEFQAFPKAKGNFLLDVTQLGLDRLWMSRYTLSLPQVNAFAIQPDRTVIGFLTDPNPSFRYCGMEISSGDMIVNRSDGAHQRTDTDLHSGTMSLATDELNVALEAVIGCNVMEKLKKPVVRPSSASMSRLLKLHRVIGQLAHDTPEVLKLPEVCRALEEQLVHLMVRSLAEGAGVETTAGRRHYNAIIARFEDYLAARLDRPLYLTEVCAALGVAERTLRAACEVHLGMGPIRFLTLRRMHLVRRALLNTDPSKTNVTRIVTEHGFWELGRFSTAYRALFGETPVVTLRRRAEPTAINLNRPSSLAAERSGRVK